jgi:hypothetical protein
MQQQSLSVPIPTLVQTQGISTVSAYLLKNSMAGQELTLDLVEEETHYQVKREYFQDQYLYADKI